MKPQRSRSRNNKNRNRGGGNNQGGNVVNRVFDSSGPEGKVRGTPSQVIEKYNQLAPAEQPAPDTDQEASNLVETPESKPKTPRAPRRKPKPKPEGDDDAPKAGGGDQPEAAE